MHYMNIGHNRRGEWIASLAMHQKPRPTWNGIRPRPHKELTIGLARLRWFTSLSKNLKVSIIYSHRFLKNVILKPMDMNLMVESKQHNCTLYSSCLCDNSTRVSKEWLIQFRFTPGFAWHGSWLLIAKQMVQSKGLASPDESNSPPLKNVIYFFVNGRINNLFCCYWTMNEVKKW